MKEYWAELVEKKIKKKEKEIQQNIMAIDMLRKVYVDSYGDKSLIIDEETRKGLNIALTNLAKYDQILYNQFIESYNQDPDLSK